MEDKKREIVNKPEQNNNPDLLFRVPRRPSSDLVEKVRQALETGNPRDLGEYYNEAKKIAFDLSTLGYYEKKDVDIMFYKFSFRTLKQKEIAELEENISKNVYSGQFTNANTVITAAYISKIAIDYQNIELFAKANNLNKDDIRIVPPPVDNILEDKVKFLLELPAPIYNLVVSKVYEFVLLVNAALELYEEFLKDFLQVES
ncbi:MAG: hypothetical protein QXI58_00180 [Candidatus Micrarchaeia archaeon]